MFIGKNREKNHVKTAAAGSQETTAEALKKQIDTLLAQNQALMSELVANRKMNANGPAGERLKKASQAISNALVALAARKKEVEEECQALRVQAEMDADQLMCDAEERIAKERKEWDENRQAYQFQMQEETANRLKSFTTHLADLAQGINLQLEALTQATQNTVEKLFNTQETMQYEEVFSQELGEIMRQQQLKHVAGSHLGGHLVIQSAQEFEALSENGFRNNTLLKSIVLPDAIKYIKPHMFFGCVNLKEITIPADVEKIGDYAFYGCQSLERVHLAPNGALKEIGDYAFSLCSSLTSLKLPKSMEKLGTGALRYCENLGNISIPLESQLKQIGSHAFQHCKRLKRFIFPEGVTQIPVSLFYGCSSLEEITIPPQITDVCNYAFKDCENLKRVEIVSEETMLEELALEGIPESTIVHKQYEQTIEE